MAVSLPVPVKIIPDNLNYRFCSSRLSKCFVNCLLNLRLFNCFILVPEKTIMITECDLLHKGVYLLSPCNFCNQPLSLKVKRFSIKGNLEKRMERPSWINLQKSELILFLLQHSRDYTSFNSFLPTPSTVFPLITELGFILFY